MYYAEHVQTNDVGEKQKELHINICYGACKLFTYLFYMSQKQKSNFKKKTEQPIFISFVHANTV